MSDPRDEYATAMGGEALERQQAAAATTWACCGEPRPGEHHPLCRHYQVPIQPAHIDGQESLL